MFSAIPILLERLEEDPIQVAPEPPPQVRRLFLSSRSRSPPFRFRERREGGAGFGGEGFPDGFQHAVDAVAAQGPRIDRRPARQHFVKQDTQAVDITPAVDVESLEACLLWTHVGGSAQEFVEMRDERLVGERVGHRLGNAEVDHLRNIAPVLLGDEDVGWFEVAVNDALLVRVLDRQADRDEQRDPIRRGELPGVAILGDGEAPHQFEHEIRTSAVGGTAIQNPGNVGMVHERQGLALRFEPGHDATGVHSPLDDFQRDLPAHRFPLFRQPDRAESALTEDRTERITPDLEPGVFQVGIARPRRGRRTQGGWRRGFRAAHHAGTQSQGKQACRTKPGRGRDRNRLTTFRAGGLQHTGEVSKPNPAKVTPGVTGGRSGSGTATRRRSPRGA